jgi:hypothetical protein
MVKRLLDQVQSVLRGQDVFSLMRRRKTALNTQLQALLVREISEKASRLAERELNAGGILRGF